MFSLSQTRQLSKKIFTEAGFAGVQTEEFVITAEFASAEEFAQFTKDISAPVKILVAGQLLVKQEEIWNAVTYASGRFAGPAGRISMSPTSIIAVAQ